MGKKVRVLSIPAIRDRVVKGATTVSGLTMTRASGPAGPNLPQGGPEQPVEGGQRWSRPFSLEHSYLLSEGEDFESGVTATVKEYADGSQD